MAVYARAPANFRFDIDGSFTRLTSAEILHAGKSVGYPAELRGEHNGVATQRRRRARRPNVVNHDSQESGILGRLRDPVLIYDK